MPALFSIDNRIDDAVARRFGLDFPAGLSLSPEFSSNFDITLLPELQFHLGWRRWVFGTTINATVGQVNRIQVRNPDASQVIIVVEQILIGSPSGADQWTGSYGYGPGNVDLATVATVFGFLDGRNGILGSQAFGMTKISHGANAAALNGTAGIVVMLANTMTPMPGGPWILTPGNAILFGGNLVNAANVYSVVFRERRVNDKELTG